MPDAPPPLSPGPPLVPERAVSALAELLGAGRPLERARLLAHTLSPLLALVADSGDAALAAFTRDFSLHLPAGSTPARELDWLATPGARRLYALPGSGPGVLQAFILAACDLSDAQWELYQVLALTLLDDHFAHLWESQPALTLLERDALADALGPDVLATAMLECAQVARAALCTI